MLVVWKSCQADFDQVHDTTSRQIGKRGRGKGRSGSRGNDIRIKLHAESNRFTSHVIWFNVDKKLRGCDRDNLGGRNVQATKKQTVHVRRTSLVWATLLKSTENLHKKTYLKEAQTT